MQRAALLMVISCGLLAAAQDCTQTVPMNALDQKTGRAVTLLSSDVFQARMGTMTVPITAIKPVKERRILVLVDQSGSMAPKNNLGSHQKEALQITEDTLAELLTDLPGGVSVAYGFFNDKMVFTEGFFSDSRQLQQAIADTRQKLQKPGSGGTALFDALQQAMLRFGTPHSGDVIVLLSDGGENKSKSTERESVKEFRRSGLRLTLLLVNQHSSEWAEPYVSTVIGLAEETGGAISTIDINDPSWTTKKDAAANQTALRRFWTEEVLSGYVLQVQVPSSLKKPRKWKVQVNTGTDAQLKHVTLQYPEKLEPCPVSTAAVH
jgi:hypothetical protein